MLYIERDDDAGCFRLIEDGVGLCTSKSRNVLVRVRDALNALGKMSLDGVTIACGADTGVAMGLCDGSFPKLIVRRPDGQLHAWRIDDCRVVEPETPARDTPSNEPPIGVRTACVLLERFLALEIDTDGDYDADAAEELVHDAKKFLADRKAAEPTDY